MNRALHSATGARRVISRRNETTTSLYAAERGEAVPSR